MPTLALLYFFGYAIFVAYWARDHYLDKVSLGLILLSVVCEACLVLTALGYWLPSLSPLRGNFALFLYSTGIAATVVEAAQEFWSLFKESEESTLFNIGVIIFVVVGLAIVCGPIFYWGFLFSFYGIQSGA